KPHVTRNENAKRVDDRALRVELRRRVEGDRVVEISDLLAVRERERGGAEPLAAVIGMRARSSGGRRDDAEQALVAEARADRHDGAVTDKAPLPDLIHRDLEAAAEDALSADDAAVREEAFVADLHQLGREVPHRRELRALADPRAQETKPRGEV